MKTLREVSNPHSRVSPGGTGSRDRNEGPRAGSACSLASGQRRYQPRCPPRGSSPVKGLSRTMSRPGLLYPIVGVRLRGVLASKRFVCAGGALGWAPRLSTGPVRCGCAATRRPGPGGRPVWTSSTGTGHLCPWGDRWGSKGLKGVGSARLLGYAGSRPSRNGVAPGGGSRRPGRRRHATIDQIREGGPDMVVREPGCRLDLSTGQRLSARTCSAKSSCNMEEG